MNNMIVNYLDGEVDKYQVPFEGFDLESFVAPMLGALIFEYKGKQIIILLDQVKKLEFEINKEED